MHTKIVNALSETGVVAIIRGIDLEHMEAVANALYEGGCRIMEVTLNTDGAYQAIERLALKFGEKMYLGAGTVMAERAAREAVGHGAQFLVTPHVGTDVIKYGVDHGIPVFAGAMTPTEIHEAYRAGASVVKVFPSSVLGPTYFRDVRGPLPHIPLLAVGGVTLDNARAFLDAGAIGWGLGSGLVKKQWVETGDYTSIVEATHRFVQQFRGD